MRHFRFLACMTLLGLLHTTALAGEAELVALVDDGCELYVNGARVDFVPGKTMTVQIAEGDVIAAKVWDIQGGTAGGLALALTRPDGKSLLTDTTWLCCRKAESDWENKQFNDKSWRRARKADLEWLENAVKKQFRGRRKPTVIWGEGGTTYLRKTVTASDFK